MNINFKALIKTILFFVIVFLAVLITFTLVRKIDTKDILGGTITESILMQK